MRELKKVIIIVSLMLCICIGLIVCTSSKYYAKNLEDILPEKNVNITKIEFFNGLNGKKVIVQDKTQITEFITDLNSYKFKKIKERPNKPGYIYNITFYNEETKKFAITFTGTYLIINEEDYEATDLNLIVDKINSFLSKVSN